MLSMEAFDFIRYIFVFFLIISVALSIAITFFKKHTSFINWFTITSISFICSVVSAFLMIFTGYAADEMNYQGPEIIMGFAIGGLSVINFFIALGRKG